MKPNEPVADLIEKAGREVFGAQMANHASSRTTQLYDRRANRHPRLLSGSHLKPSLHARMETAEIVHDADPFQNRLALGASREIDVEAPVRRPGGRFPT